MISCYIASFPDDVDIVFKQMRGVSRMKETEIPDLPWLPALAEAYEDDLCVLTGYTLTQSEKIQASSCAMQVVRALGWCYTENIVFVLRDADRGLHPRVVCELMRRMSKACKTTRTHAHFSVTNPSALDGLNLDTDHLFAIERNSLGVVMTRQVQLPSFTKSQEPLSSLWISGILGAVP